MYEYIFRKDQVIYMFKQTTLIPVVDPERFAFWVHIFFIFMGILGAKSNPYSKLEPVQKS